MSTWRAIATLFGPVLNRPDPEDVPYGTLWHDPATGTTWATDETQWYQISAGGSGGAGGAVGPWIADTLAQSVTDDDLTLLDGHRTIIPICTQANVGCVVAHLSAPVTDGTITVQLTVNGADAGDPIILDDGACVTADLGVFVTVCDVIGFQVTTSGDLAPAGEDLTVMVQFAAPTPPQDVEVFLAGGLPALTGEYEIEVEVPVETDLAGELPALDGEFEIEVVEPESAFGGTLIREEVVEP